MTKTTHKIDNLQEKLVKSQVALIFLFMFVYLYFVNSTAFGAASYEDINRQITQTQSQIGELELALIQEKRSINRGRAEDFALVTMDESDLAFATRVSTTILTINE